MYMLTNVFYFLTSTFIRISRLETYKINQNIPLIKMFCFHIDIV